MSVQTLINRARRNEPTQVPTPDKPLHETYPEGLLRMIASLRTYRVDEAARGQRVLTPMQDSLMVSSRHRDSDRHALLLDIDYEAFVVSSPGGRNHLYLDVPGGITRRQQRRVFKALSRAGVIEKEWANACTHRRAETFLRLPWSKK